MRVELNYGKGKLPVDLPDDWEVRVIRKKAMPVTADPAAAVRTLSGEMPPATKTGRSASCPVR